MGRNLCLGLQPLVFQEQLFVGFHAGRVQGNAGNRADLHALGLIEMPHAFGTAIRIYLIDFFTEMNCGIRTLRLTDITIDAFIRNHQCHRQIHPHVVCKAHARIMLLPIHVHCSIQNRTELSQALQLLSWLPLFVQGPFLRIIEGLCRKCLHMACISPFSGAQFPAIPADMIDAHIGNQRYTGP